MLAPASQRVPFILLNSVFSHFAARAPNPPANLSERDKFESDTKTSDPIARFVWWFGVTLRLLMHGMNLIEIYVILSTYYPPLRILPLHSAFFLPAISNVSRIRLTPSFLLGALMVCAGSMLRVICYQRLGRCFTFELSLRKDHELITDGPYSFVRHPSYTGSLTFLSGLLICQMGSGSWWAEFGLWRTIFGKIVGGLWLFHVFLLESQLIVRTGREDEVLRKEFPAQWESWSRDTPYKLFPGIY